MSKLYKSIYQNLRDKHYYQLEGQDRRAVLHPEPESVYVTNFTERGQAPYTNRFDSDRTVDPTKVVLDEDSAQGYQLTVYENDRREYAYSHKYTITGQLYGIPQCGGGNISGERFLQQKLLNCDDLTFDSESGQFFAYANRLGTINQVFRVFDVFIMERRKAAV